MKKILIAVLLAIVVGGGLAFYFLKDLKFNEIAMAEGTISAKAFQVGVFTSYDNALNVAVSAMNAVHQIGMPEARIILAQAALTVALSPKSNTSYLAINSAIEDVKNIDIGVVPMHLRNAEIAGMDEHGYGKGYKYPHDYENSKVEQQYLPDKLIGKKYFIPKEWEKNLGEDL